MCSHDDEQEYLATPEERVEAAKERIEVYWLAHNHPCASCLDEMITELHILLAHGGVLPDTGVEIINAAQAPIDKKTAN